MKKLLIAAVILVVLLLVVGLAFGGMFVSRRNEMVTMREGIDAAWAQVDTVIQRRADLVPNLVATVKGVAAQEKEVFTNIANARAAMSGARTPSDRIEANDQMSGALSRLLVVVENYPELRSSQNFIRLQDELAGTENRIAVERRKYNQAVQQYNTYIQLFPNSIVASFAGYQREDAYFRTTEEARQAPPAVNFNQPEPQPQQ
ncbi:MAG: LemA family protein [Acidobacteria bacterium]|nr:LemA family protein [Acidobacteriota bacterium]